MAKLKEDGVDVAKDVEVVDRIIGVKEDKLSILIGTIVKEMDPKRRPDVASEFNDRDTCSFLFPGGMVGDGSKVEGEQESLRSYLFDSEKGDVLHLEDESGRVELSARVGGTDGDNDAMDIDNKHGLDANKICTGVVAAVIGKVSVDKGVMHVESIHFAGAPSEAENKSTQDARGSMVDEKEESDDPMILLVSGLACGTDSPTDNQTGGSLALRREMLLEYLTNSKLGNGAAISRVIVAGGGIAPKPKPSLDSDKGTSKSYMTNAKNKKANHESSHMTLSLRELDMYFSEILGSGIPVDYIPGFHDPTNANWPQRPIHSCLLPNSCAFVDLFQRSTNPYENVVGGERILGSDGLNVTDLRRYLTDGNVVKDEDVKEQRTAVSSMEALRQTLEYGHIAPTGPDSLPMFPSSESDPFIVSKRPSIYFSGNAAEFETCLVTSSGDEVEKDEGSNNLTRLVCIPNFALTGEVVLVNVRTLDCEVISYNDAGL